MKKHIRLEESIQEEEIELDLSSISRNSVAQPQESWQEKKQKIIASVQTNIKQVNALLVELEDAECKLEDQQANARDVFLYKMQYQKNSTNSGEEESHESKITKIIEKYTVLKDNVEVLRDKYDNNEEAAEVFEAYNTWFIKLEIAIERLTRINVLMTNNKEAVAINVQ